VVTSTGALDRGSGVASVSKLGTGYYGVTFNQTVTACSYQISVGPPGTLGSPDGLDGIGEAGKSATLATQVIVGTYATNLAAADKGFSLAVFC
jgi:hypothetical protein